MPLFDIIRGVNIPEIVCALPEQHFTLTEYAPHLLDEKMAKRMARETGFHTLRIAPENVTASDLFAHAAEKLLASRNREDIAALVFVSQTPDYVMPATSHVLQHRLGLSNSVLCLDINEGCSGFITGLYTASLLSTKLNAPVLLGCGDTLTHVSLPSDRATRCIFGDESAAILVEPGKHDIPFAFISYGDRRDVIIMENSASRRKDNPKNEGRIYLDGIEILNFALSEVPDMINDYMKKYSISHEDITLYAAHQANKLITDNLADTLGIPREKVPFTSGDIGNESSASIPSVLARVNGKYDLSRVMCMGFGVGMSAGVCVADFSETKTSEVYVS